MEGISTMPTIYISDNGDDKNSGLSPEEAVYSWKRAKKLHGGKNDYDMHFIGEAATRIKKEIANKQRKKS
jgi:hypothetical protein